MNVFSELGVPEALAERLAAAGITEPTPVQRLSLPPVLAGKDALVVAPTGTGKTLAYLLPIMARLAPQPEKSAVPQGPQALVLVPTPELALQVRDVARMLAGGEARFAIALGGGANPARQAEALKRQPTLVVGTPGRVLEFVRSGRLLLDRVRAVALDEVDQLVDAGNRATTEMIVKKTPSGRQVVVATATLGPEATAWTTSKLKDAVRVEPPVELNLPESLTHQAFVVDLRDKIALLRRLVRNLDPTGAIAFVNRTGEVDRVVEKLAHHQLRVAGLHAGALKFERAAAMRDFKAGKLQLLVATELASRGLDLSGVSLVFNLDLPTDAGHYVHRVGRTARMGRPGTAITLVTPQEAFVLDKLEKALGFKFERPVYAEGAVLDEAEAPEWAKRKQKAAARPAKRPRPAVPAAADAPAPAAPPARPKKEKAKGPTASALAKGKAKKAKRKSTGTWKPAGGKPAQPAPSEG